MRLLCFYTKPPKCDTIVVSSNHRLCGGITPRRVIPMLGKEDQILKALSLIAAELHIQNIVSISKEEKLKVDFSLLSVEKTPELVEHFLEYFKGEQFNPFKKLKPIPKRK